MHSKETALITGVNGFVGHHLSHHLSQLGYTVCGTDRDQVCKSEHVEHYFPADIRNSQAVTDLMSRFNYSRIFHLAAISNLLQADSSPRLTMEVNLLGTIDLLDAAVEVGSKAKILLIGSSKQYAGDQENVLTEQSELYPKSFYGISKLACELSAKRYESQTGLDLYYTRSFNHTGPGQSPDFVCSEWARQVAMIEKGASEPVLRVGNLNATLDFSDVRDVANAYFLILERGRSSEVYNVCSGDSIPLSFIANYLTSKTKQHIRVETCPEMIQGNGRSTVQRGDNSKLVQDTGWKREFSMEETLDDLYRYWMERV
ncbi:MAG: GDP-mannose 4,6-dehydratase [Fibrobacterota bacterium]